MYVVMPCGHYLVVKENEMHSVVSLSIKLLDEEIKLNVVSGIRCN